MSSKTQDNVLFHLNYKLGVDLADSPSGFISLEGLASTLHLRTSGEKAYLYDCLVRMQDQGNILLDGDTIRDVE